MVALPAILAVGEGLTVIMALPVMLGLGAVTLQFVATSVTLTMVYVLLVAGATFTVAPLAIPLDVKVIVPSVNTTLNVPGAGRVKVKAVLFPAQIVAVPAMLAVGRGLTVTTALPVMFGLGATEVQVVATFVTLTIV